MKNTIGQLIGCLVIALLVGAATPAIAAQQSGNQASSLPPAVLKAFQKTYATARITATSQERQADKTVYRVESDDKGRRRVVLYGADAAVIEVAEQIQEKELPAPVAAAMHSHPRAIFGGGTKVTRGSAVHYQLTLKGTRKTTMIAKPDGTVVSFQ